MLGIPARADTDFYRLTFDSWRSDMPIQSGDVKLLKSAVMADVPEGGGAPTGTHHSRWRLERHLPDISELDRAGGRVNLRKSLSRCRPTTPTPTSVPT